MKDWRIEMAKYQEHINAVEYNIVRSFNDCETALNHYNALAQDGHPVELHHKDACNPENMNFAMIASKAYKAEHKKIVD